MGVWYVVLLSAIVGAVANEHYPNNPPYLLEEVNATSESRVLERVEHLLQTLSAKIKVLDDSIDELKRDISSKCHAQNETHEMLKSINKSFTQRMTNLEHKLEPLSQIIRDTNEMIQTTNESFTQRITILDQKLERSLEDTAVYFMQPDSSKNVTFQVSHDLTTNYGIGSKWIVFQRRFNGSVDFNRNWTDYKQGFGDLRGEHWLGLDKLHSIVKTGQHELLIVLEDFDDVIKYAHYADFKIGDESEKYVLKSVGKYTGTAGDAFSEHQGYAFSTYDQDNDTYSGSCSQTYKGAWWFHSCLASHLNGLNLSGKTNRWAVGITWSGFRGLDYSLKSSKMMVRRVA